LDRLLSIGPGRVITVDGVQYRERRASGLRSAFTGSESGVREYEVRFPDADARKRPFRIRATPTRIYDDLSPDPRAELVRALDPLVRPGDRVLELGCGTGAGSRHLAYLVGPSGGVVALDRDGESIRFARQRYTAAQIGFELGWVETLSGELDNAFDAVVATDPFRDDPGHKERVRTLDEIVRVLRPGGHLECIGSSDESAELARRTLSEHALDPVGPPRRAGSWRGVVWVAPGPTPPGAARRP
jgi:SAM-dependent methyltransferase